MDDETDVDAPRALITRKAQELGITMKQISRMIGKNEAYMHQYLHGRSGQKSPRFLPEDVRPIVASMLGLSEDALRPPGLSRRPLVGASELPAPPVAQATGARIPVYLDTDSLDPAAAREWITPRDLAGPVSCGLWITRQRGRLHPGDFAYVRFAQPARRGDVVVVLRGQEIVVAGDLTDLTEHEVEISGSRLPIAGATVCKVIAIILA